MMKTGVESGRKLKAWTVSVQEVLLLEFERLSKAYSKIKWGQYKITCQDNHARPSRKGSRIYKYEIGGAWHLFGGK